MRPPLPRPSPGIPLTSLARALLPGVSDVLGGGGAGRGMRSSEKSQGLLGPSVQCISACCPFAHSLPGCPQPAPGQRVKRPRCCSSTEASTLSRLLPNRPVQVSVSMSVSVSAPGPFCVGMLTSCAPALRAWKPGVSQAAGNPGGGAPHQEESPQNLMRFVHRVSPETPQNTRDWGWGGAGAPGSAAVRLVGSGVCVLGGREGRGRSLSQAPRSDLA